MSLWLMNNIMDFELEKDIIKMESGPGTKLFNAVSGYHKANNFPFYYRVHQGDFIVRCKITPEFKEVYDLGCIVIFDHQDKWIKFAYENTDTGCPTVVSVITDGVSEYFGGDRVHKESIWMQVCRIGNCFSLHYSTDQTIWMLDKIFQLEMNQEVKVGISVQSPKGKSGICIFEDFELLENSYSGIQKYSF